MYPRWRRISEGDWCLVTFLINIYKMAEHAGGLEEELFSLSMRPFQQAKQNGKTICFKCFEEDGLVNFFLEGAGLSQHFRTMHRNAAVDSTKCKTVFEDRHGEETTRLVERLGRLRLQSVSILFYKEAKMNYEYDLS